MSDPKEENKIVNGQTGPIVDLRTNATDDTGEYLSWTLKEVDDGFTKLQYWEATGKDGKSYTIEETPPVKTGVVKIADTATKEDPKPPKS